VKTIPIALQTEYNKSTARIARFLWIRRRDGNVYRFTSASKRVVVEGETYLPSRSVNDSNIASNANMDVDDLDAAGLLQPGVVTEDDIRATRWDDAEYRIFRANWASPSDGIEKCKAGRLGVIRVKRQSFLVQLLGMLDTYTTVIGKKTQPGCRTSLGTEECGVVPTIVSGVIDLCETDLFTLSDSARTEPDVFFDEGIITIDFPTGPLSYEIKAYIQAGGIFVTKTIIHYDATGMDYVMSEGCTRRFQEDCVGRFANGARFRGEPWLRGNDALIQVGRHT